MIFTTGMVVWTFIGLLAALFWLFILCVNLYLGHEYSRDIYDLQSRIQAFTNAPSENRQGVSI